MTINSNGYTHKKIQFLKKASFSSTSEKVLVSVFFCSVFIWLCLDLLGLSFYLLYHVLWIFLAVYHQQVCKDFQIEILQKDDLYLHLSFIKSNSFFLIIRKSSMPSLNGKYKKSKGVIVFGKLLFLIAIMAPFVWFALFKELRGS